MAQQNQWVDVGPPTPVSGGRGRGAGPGPQQPQQDVWEDITTPVDVTQPETGPMGYINRAWDEMFNKSLIPWFSEKGKELGDWITDPSRRLDEEGNVMPLHPLAGFGAGVVQGAGDVVSQLFTPGDLAATVATGGASLAARTGGRQAARGLTAIARGLSAPVAIHGAERITDPEASMGERLTGVGELAGGAAGTFQPVPEMRPRGATPTPTATPEATPPRPGDITEEMVAAYMERQAAEEAASAVPEDVQFSRDIPSERQDVNLDVNQMLRQLGVEGDASLEVLDPTASRLNASGESAASMEAMSRQRGMQDRGEQFVVYDRAGNKRPLIGPDAVDYRVRPGETYGVEGPEGFRMLDDAGGRPPQTWEDINPKTETIQPSLSERPVSVRSLDELEERVALLESKPALNRGGQRALQEMRDEIARRKSGESPEPGFDTPDFGDKVTPFPKGGKRQVYDIAEQIRNNLDDTDIIDDLTEKAEAILARETDPEIIEDNFRQLEQYLEYAKKDRNPDEIEALGYLRDVALDYYRKATRGGGIQAARTGTGKVGIGADVQSLGKVLGTSLYKGDIAPIATKELLQNAIDAIRPLGKEGKVGVNVDSGKSQIEVFDNGPGMTREEVETVFTDLGASGKRSDESAIGGFGLAKAAPLLGGESVQMRTVARNANGQLVEITFEGTPDQLLAGDVDLIETIVPEGTHTGTAVRVKLPDGAYTYGARSVVENIGKMSNFEGNVYSTSRSIFDDPDFELRGKTPSLEDPAGLVRRKLGEHYGDRTIEKFEPGETVAQLENPSGNVSLIIPKNIKPGSHSSIELHLRNKGMYQGSYDKQLPSQIDDIPGEVIVDIDALVPEGHTDYPFTANRENLRGSLEKLVNQYIDENIVMPALAKKTKGIQDLYDGMPSVITRGGKQVFFHDTGAKATAEEMSRIADDPVIQSIGEQIVDAIEEALVGLSKFDDSNTWAARIERGGIVLDENLRGVHIPNPSGEGTAVMINPLQLMARSPEPDMAAAGFLHTILHEIVHSSPEGRGHNESFTIKLGDMYEAFGAARSVQVQQKFLDTVAPNGSYTPEVRKLLREYQEIRGREATKKDALVRTGVGAKTSKGGAEGISPDTQIGGSNVTQSADPGAIFIKKPDPEVIKHWMTKGYVFDTIRESDGAIRMKKSDKPVDVPILEAETNRPNARPTPSNAARMAAGQPPQVPPRGGSGPSGGSGSSKGPKAPVKGNRWVVEAFNLPRAVMASYDFSAPLRQGLPLAHRKEFWGSLGDMFRSWKSDDVYRAIQDDILDRPLFRSRTTQRGKPLKSFAEEAGLKFTDLDSLSGREERIMSTWAEKIPGFGRGIRASNRAYTTFLNKLRADTFESLIKEAKIFGANGEVNLPLARAIADFVNTASGRGHLGNLEKSAVALNTLFFSPRLLQSRLKMLNPMYYVRADPFVRKQALKSLLSIAAVGNTLGQLGKMAGAEVETNPNNSDYGKIKIGHIRLDPYGGFQQFIVAANRLLRPQSARIGSGTNTGIVPIDMMTGTAAAGGSSIESSTSGKQYDLWNPKGPYDPTHASVAGRFLRSKLHPILGFVYSLLSGGKEMTGEKMKFGLDPSKPIQSTMDNAIAQRFIPIVLQDLYELAQEDPKLAVLLGIPTVMGMSSQTYGRPGER